MKHNQFITHIKEFNEEQRTITMIGSTEKADRVGDIVRMAGVDLTNYKKNPVILFNHDYDKVVGKALDVQIIDNKLIFKIQFADTELAREIYYLLKNGYMNASSIGFIGREYEANEHGGLTFTKIELLELSIVSVPCNPDAIVALRKDFEEKRVSKNLFDMLTPNVKMAGEFTEEDIKAIKDAVKYLSELIKEESANENKSEEVKEENKEEEKQISECTDDNTDATDENTIIKSDNQENDNQEEIRKSYTNEEIIKEILKSLGGK